MNGASKGAAYSLFCTLSRAIYGERLSSSPFEINSGARLGGMKKASGIWLLAASLCIASAYFVEIGFHALILILGCRRIKPFRFCCTIASSAGEEDQPSTLRVMVPC